MSADTADPMTQTRMESFTQSRATFQGIAQPENRAQWAAQTTANFRQAQSLARGVMDRLREKEAADAANKAAEQDKAKVQADRVRNKVMNRVKGHEGVINESHKNIREIEMAMVQVEGCQARLKQERYTRFADKTVCEKRIAIREKRPAAESFEDAVQRCLQQELQVLSAAREELMVGEMQAKSLLHELQAIRAQLSSDTGSRRLAVHHDLSTLRPSLPEAGEVTSGAPALKPAYEAPGAAAQELHEKSIQVVKNSYALKEKTDRIIPKIRFESQNVTKRVNDSLAKRTKELHDLKKQYEDNIKTVTHAITETSRALHREEDRLEVASNVEQQKEIIATLRTSLNELTATKKTLVEDLRSKVAALEVDNSCRRITPQIASEPPRKMKTSASAPTLNARATAGGFRPQGHAASIGSSSVGSRSLGCAESDASTTATLGNQASPKTMGHAGASSSLKAAAAAALA